MKSVVEFLLCILALSFIHETAHSQDLEQLLEEYTEDAPAKEIKNFRGSRLLNGQSVVLMKEGELDFRIHHRFGKLNSGSYEMWGLDQAHIHYGFDYGIFDWLNLGVGRGTYEKTFNGFVKFRILQQNSENIPLTITTMNGAYRNTLKILEEIPGFIPVYRFDYVSQILIARKQSDFFSLQLMPTHIHRNLTSSESDKNDLFSLGIGGDIKLFKRLGLSFEYYYNLLEENPLAYRNPLSIGIAIETGGHVFQIVMTNSLAMIENGFIGETTGEWLNGDIHFGFNISRVFSLY